MFSTMSRQKKAEELVKEAKKERARADEAFESAQTELQEQVQTIDEIRNHLIQQTMKEFHRRFEAIHNEPAVELPPLSETTISQQLEPLYRKSELPPVEIEEVGGGKGGAFFLSLLAVIVTVASALLIGAVALNLPLKLETFTQLPRLEKILAWLGGGAYDPSLANPLYGAIGLGAAVIAVWLIVWSIAMGKAAGRNLKKAEATYEKAKAYADQKDRYTQSMESLAHSLKKLAKDYETFDIFMEEFNAVLRRIAYTEGEDFKHYKPKSQEAVRRAAECAAAIAPLLTIALITTEGDPSTQLTETLPKAEALRIALIEDKPCGTAASSLQDETVIERPKKMQEVQTEDGSEDKTSQAEEA